MRACACDLVGGSRDGDADRLTDGWTGGWRAQIQSSVDRIQAMMKNSSELVRNAMRKDRALQKADASYKLSVARGFDTKTSTRDLVNTKAKRVAK